MMVSDGAVRIGSARVPKSPKMWRLKDCIVGIAGELAAGERFARWITKQEGPKPKGNYDALVLCRDGEIIWWAHGHNALCIDNDFYAIGSGRDFALGSFEAMADLGLPLDPRIAVRSAIKQDANSEEPLHTLRWLRNGKQ